MWLISQLDALPNMPALIALGPIAHETTLNLYGLSPTRFRHGVKHILPDGRRLIDSYHCSRYNQNTGRLTAQMFETISNKCWRIMGSPAKHR